MEDAARAAVSFESLCNSAASPHAVVMLVENGEQLLAGTP